MRAVVQRVKSATLKVNEKLISQINEGLLVFLGVGLNDTEKDALYFVDKLPKLRLFDDEKGLTNKSIQEVGGEFLLVSNFTLYGNTKGTNRPDFCHAAGKDLALKLYELVAQKLNEKVPTKLGVFGADMQIETHLNGPFTIIMDSTHSI